LAPQSAFLQGLVKVQGDMGFAMLLGTALLA
jgi:putative sterol carrier protein